VLFNSYLFIFLFLPACLTGFFVLGRRAPAEAAIFWLVLCSLFFYGWWNPPYLWLIAASIGLNFSVGKAIENCRRHSLRRTLLTVGVVLNLVWLGYFKYANFFVDTVNAAFRSEFFIPPIILPLAISFFTFQQIAYLIDTHRSETQEHNFLHYCLFVTFFPQLIAGPIVHHKEMLPQFLRASTFKLQMDNIAVGSGLFLFGLFKKVILADGFAEYVTPIYSAVDKGVVITFFEGWGAALGYTLQLYFDFSGYSDMAIGLALLFGITLPVNFYSPYRAKNIIDFWQRWHMTLSRFLRDYVYIPLGGNRRGSSRRYLNLMITMLLGGLWHGAGWTFVLWGGLHGLYLMINHAWRRLPLFSSSFPGRGVVAWLGQPLTFIAVVVGWVFFRAESYDSATTILAAMTLQHGVSLVADYGTTAQAIMAFGGIDLQLGDFATRYVDQDLLTRIVIGLAIVFWAPNTLQIFGVHRPEFDLDRASLNPAERIVWKPNLAWGLVVGVTGVYAILSLTQVSEFLYFQF